VKAGAVGAETKGMHFHHGGVPWQQPTGAQFWSYPVDTIVRASPELPPE
jgi:hypothetical protein